MTALLLALLAATLRSGTITRPDGARVEVKPDDFTKLMLYTERRGDGRPDSAAIRQALVAMRGSHCAIAAIGRVIESGPIRDVPNGIEIQGSEIKSILFGESFDPHGHYDFRTREIVLNAGRPYLRDPENLSKLLYHEALHHAERKLGLRRAEETGQYHDPARIPVILRALLGSNHACLRQVQGDGTLINADGKPLEPGFLPGRPLWQRPAVLDEPGPPNFDQADPQGRVKGTIEIWRPERRQ